MFNLIFVIIQLNTHIIMPERQDTQLHKDNKNILHTENVLK